MTATGNQPVCVDNISALLDGGVLGGPVVLFKGSFRAMSQGQTLELADTVANYSYIAVSSEGQCCQTCIIADPDGKTCSIPQVSSTNELHGRSVSFNGAVMTANHTFPAPLTLILGFK